MGRTLKTDIPGPDWRRSLERLRREGPEALFHPELERPRALVVEIGFGRGEFVARLAEEAPDCAFLAVETSRKRVIKMARRLAKTEIRNLRLVEAPGEQVVEALAEDSVDAFWVNFPDPWPKKRHARRRLVQPPLVEALARRLRPGGTLHLATDHVPYAEQMHEVLAGEPRLENLHSPAPWLPEEPGRQPTAYESEWRAEGRPLHFFLYRRTRAAAENAADPEPAPPRPAAGLPAPADAQPAPCGAADGAPARGRDGEPGDRSDEAWTPANR